MSEMGNPLEKLCKLIDFELFRSLLEQKLMTNEKNNNAGAKPFDYVMMFKVITLQRYFGLGNKLVRQQITYRMSFKEFF